MSKVGDVLKENRLKTGLTVKEVSQILRTNGYERAAEKTIYSWENNNSQPTPDILLFLCGIYGIEDVLGTFGYKKTSTKLTTEEYANIKKYRELDDHGRELIDTILDKEIDRCRQEKAPIKPEPEKEEVPPYPIAAFGGIPEGAQDEIFRKFWEMEKEFSDPKYNPSYIDNCSHEDDEE